MNTKRKHLFGIVSAHTVRSGIVAILAEAADAGDLAPVLAAAVSMPDCEEGKPLPGSIVWMPCGTHAINASTVSGGTFSGKVICDEQAFRAVVASQKQIEAGGRKVWLDFNHEDAAASAWVDSFTWDNARGIVANLKWTAGGEDALRGRAFRSFSPAFLCEKATGRVTGLLGGDRSAGGLVNAQAFTAMPALIAARMAPTFPNKPAHGGNSAHSNTMTKEQVIALLAALKVSAPADASLETLVALHAKTVSDIAAAEIAANAANAAAVQAAKAKQENDAAYAAAAVLAKQTADNKLASELAEVRAALAVFQASEKSAGPGNLSVKLNPIEAIKAMAKETNSVKRGRIYCDELRAFTSRKDVFEVMAANSFGTMVGDLVVLKALDLLKLKFPILSRISTDFSAEQVKYGQNIRTRTITIPTVTAYNTGTGYAVSDMTTSDVTVAINAHKSLTVLLNANDAGSTGRDLFGEQVEAMNYALGKDLVDALYALFVIATYTNATTVAVASMTRATLPVALAQAMNTRGVPQGKRSLLLNAAAFAQMAIDPSIVQLATYQKPELITGYALPEVSGFQPIEAINLPATGNMAGFALSPDAAVIATRLPLDYSQALPGANYGNVQTVTNPDTGISVLKTDFVDHKLGTANSRIAWMYGVAAGQVASGQIVKTA